VFALPDDYSFGILQSELHWLWFTERCSTMKSDPRYTSNSVFDTFPWPQEATIDDIGRVASAAVALRAMRRDLKKKHGLPLRDLYRAMEMPGDHPLKAAHSVLDQAVRATYGIGSEDDPLSVLLDLNFRLAEAEEDENGKPVQGPGLPSHVTDPVSMQTTDCISV